MLRVSESIAYPASVAAVAAMYADADYSAVRGETLGAESASAEVSGSAAGAFTVTTTMQMPTDQAPDMVRSVIGQRVTVIEKQEWSAPAADGSRSGLTTIQVKGTPATVRAQFTVTGDSARATMAINGELAASVPLIGGRIEKAVEPSISTVFQREANAAARWLSER